jgi:hypothetical protein
MKKDSDDVWKICLEMVKKDREKMLSNEKKEEMKEVFEG